MLLCPRYHLFEINDQPWFPQYLREKVQSCLTLAWTFRIPLLQHSSPAQFVSSTLSRILDPHTSSYTYVDFCAGAGGPTPFIEQDLNARLHAAGDPSVKVVLTDLHPHLEAWTAAAKKSENLGYVARPVDAANAPRDLLKGQCDGSKKVFRLFNLAFHHFDDDLGARILANSVDTADGFGIFELQARTLSSFITIFLLGPLFFLITPFYFWRSPGHLFFTYIIPIIPAVLVFDGYVSSLRTRSVDEVVALLRKDKEVRGWNILDGEEMHTWPMGKMTWIVGLKQ